MPAQSATAPAEAQAIEASGLLNYCSAAGLLFERYEAVRLFESSDRDAIVDVWTRLLGPLIAAQAEAPEEILPELTSEAVLVLDFIEVARSAPNAALPQAQVLSLSTPGSSLYKIQLYNFQNCGVGFDPTVAADDSGVEVFPPEVLANFIQAAGLACEAVAPDFEVAAIAPSMNGYCLGPAALTQADVVDAETDEREGALFFRLSPAGQAAFEQTFATCFAKSIECPVGAVAIVIDDLVEAKLDGKILPAGTELGFLVRGTGADAAAMADRINSGSVDFSLHPILSDFS